MTKLQKLSQRKRMFNFVEKQRWHEIHCLKKKIENKEKFIYSLQEEVKYRSLKKGWNLLRLKKNSKNFKKFLTKKSVQMFPTFFGIEKNMW